MHILYSVGKYLAYVFRAYNFEAVAHLQDAADELVVEFYMDGEIPITAVFVFFKVRQNLLTMVYGFLVSLYWFLTVWKA